MIQLDLKQFYFNCNINQRTDLKVQLFSIVLCINSVNVDDANEVSVVVFEGCVLFCADQVSGTRYVF